LPAASKAKVVMPALSILVASRLAASKVEGVRLPEEFLT
jgi:hypothetical protein